MRGAPSSGIRFPTDQSRACNIGQGCHLAVAQSHVKMLACPGPSTTQKCSHDGIGCIQAGCQIRHGNTHFDGGAIPAARDMHQPHFCLHHDVIACPGTVGTCVAISGDAGINQARVNPVHRLEVHLVFFQCVRQEVLHQDITVLDHFMKDFHPRRMSKGKTERLLIPIDLSMPSLGIETMNSRWIARATHREEVGALSRPINLIPPDVLRIRGTPCARVVASGGMLNFDDLRPTTIRPVSSEWLRSQ